MKQYIKQCSDIGKLTILIGFLVAAPLMVLPFYPSEAKYASSFLIPSIVAISIGIVLCYFSQHSHNVTQWKSSMQKNSLTVLFAWGFGFLAGASPFVLANFLTPTRALFEAVSGWTTTGLSVMDVTKTPHIFLFHRSFMQFSGGLGFVMVMILFIQGKQAMNLFNAEGHPDKLMPNLKRTAQTIFLMYFGFVLVGTIAYRVVGMPIFDGLCHAMCALSTGGFSNKLNSIGEYNHLGIEAVTIGLMIIGTTNFAVLLMMTKRKWKQVIKISELRFLVGLLVVMVPVTALGLSLGTGMNIFEGLRHSVFNIISALSTSGFATGSYTEWTQFTLGIMILMMLIGGGIGSTAGGIKLSRIYVFLRIMMQNIRKRLSSQRQVETLYYHKAQGKTVIDHSLMVDTIGFIGCYLVIYIIGSLLITLTANTSLLHGMFEFASSLGTVGLSIGITGPDTNTATLIVEMIGMILGRLEIFIVIIGIFSGVSLIRSKIKK